MSGFFAEQAASDSLRIPGESSYRLSASRTLTVLSDLTYIFKWEPSVNHWQTPPFCSSVRGGTSHPAISDAPNVQHTPGDHFISASVHAPLSQPPIRSLAAISQGVPDSFYANGAAQAEHYWLDKVRPRVEHAKSKTTVDAMRMPGIQIGVNQVRSGDIGVLDYYLSAPRSLTVICQICHILWNAWVVGKRPLFARQSARAHHLLQSMPLSMYPTPPRHMHLGVISSQRAFMPLYFNHPLHHSLPILRAYPISSMRTAQHRPGVIGLTM